MFVWKASTILKNFKEYLPEIYEGLKNSIIQGNEKLIATIGLEDIVVVDTDDVTLICHKNNTQEVKEVINNLKICNRNEYL